MVGLLSIAYEHRKRGYIALVVVPGNSRIWNRANVKRRIGITCDHLAQPSTSAFPAQYLARSYPPTCHFQQSTKRANTSPKVFFF